MNLPPRVRFAVSVLVGVVAGPAVTVGVPLWYWWYQPQVLGRSDPMNLGLFFGGLGILAGLAIAATGLSDVWDAYRKRRRFEELVEGKRKSELVKSIGELEEIAQELPESYQERLERVKEREGIP